MDTGSASPRVSPTQKPSRAKSGYYGRFMIELSTEGGKPGVVVGPARHGLQLHDLAAEHGVIADREARWGLDADARLRRIVIAQGS